MTNEQSAIFKKILDTSWEVKELQGSGKWADAWEKQQEHLKNVKELKDSMGEKEYDNFMNMGKKMFAIG